MTRPSELGSVRAVPQDRKDRVIRRLLKLSSVSLNIRSFCERSRILLTA